MVLVYIIHYEALEFKQDYAKTAIAATPLVTEVPEQNGQIADVVVVTFRHAPQIIHGEGLVIDLSLHFSSEGS